MISYTPPTTEGSNLPDKLLGVGPRYPQAGYFVYVDSTVNPPRMSFDSMLHYYMCLHFNKEDFTADSNKMLAVRISRALRLPVQKVIDWVAPLPYLANLDDFCNIALVKNSGTVALSGIDRRVLWAMTGTGWFGSADTKEVLAVSLEFPPAFVSMVYTGTTDRLARKAALSQLIEKEGRTLGAQAYCQRIDGLIRELKIV